VISANTSNQVLDIEPSITGQYISNATIVGTITEVRIVTSNGSVSTSPNISVPVGAPKDLSA
jgi:hypothetical protein